MYQRLGKIYTQLGEKEKKEQLYQFFAQKLGKTTVFKKENASLAKTLYSIGDDFLKEGREKEVIFWWEKAVKAAPEWSYFYVDLASLYVSLGELNQAEETLNNCLNFYFPRKHCQEYLERLEKGKKFEPPGFWREKILAIPD